MTDLQTPERPDSRAHMLGYNARQKEFYESRFDASASSAHAPERAANLATNTWTRLRRRIMRLRAGIGLEERNLSLHREWLGDLTNARVLDLGCFDGNALSLYMARSCREYVGVDLSEKAIARLNEKLAREGLASARGYAADFLKNDFPDGRFDVVYAYSVLHHFSDLEVLLKELRRVLAPGGIIISTDPMRTEPLNRLARVLYRPFQSDRDWEWPFSYGTFRMIRRHFEIADLQGLQGMSKWGYPLQLVPGLGGVGRAISQAGLRFDERHARKIGVPLYLCWHVSMCLRRPMTA